MNELKGHCDKCGRYIPSNEGTIRQGKDGDTEIICNSCVEAELTIEQPELVCAR